MVQTFETGARQSTGLDNLKKPGRVENDETSAGAITLRVYNYAQVNRPALLAAESKATRILAGGADLDSYVCVPTCVPVDDPSLSR